MGFWQRNAARQGADHPTWVRDQEPPAETNAADGQRQAESRIITHVGRAGGPRRPETHRRSGVGVRAHAQDRGGA